MIPELRRDFNARFTAAKYQTFLTLLDERCGTHVKFRVCETPCFFPEALLEKMVRYGQEICEPLVRDPGYLAAADRTIPSAYFVPGVTAHPLFVQADFGLDQNLEPKLVEIQGFPSLYAYQPVLASAYCDAYSLDPALRSMWAEPHLFCDAVLGGHDPENVVLAETEPQSQKTLADFLVTERLCGIRTVDIAAIERRGRRLFHDGIPIHRIYNRAIVDELIRNNVRPGFRFADDLDVEWAGHPNWFFRLSKFSLPYVKHPSVPRSWFLDSLERVPGDLENYVLKPLYSFAGLGVVVGPSREELDAIPGDVRSRYLLQERVQFKPVIETPFGPTKAEVRIMYIWTDQMRPYSTIIRMGRGRMMGVDHNRDMEWVGASAGFFC